MIYGGVLVFDVVGLIPRSVGARPRTPVAASSTGKTEMRTTHHLHAAVGRGLATPARFCPRSDPPKGALVGLRLAGRSRPGARSRFNQIGRTLHASWDDGRAEDCASPLDPRLCAAAAVRGEYKKPPTLVEPTSSATADTGSTPVASTPRSSRVRRPLRASRLPHASERGLACERDRHIGDCRVRHPADLRVERQRCRPSGGSRRIRPGICRRPNACQRGRHAGALEAGAHVLGDRANREGARDR